MITLEQFFMGRDARYPSECTPAVKANAAATVERVNLALGFAAADGVILGDDLVASGWRPPEVNDATSNAAKTSTHLIGEACDLRDTPARDLARWMLRNLDKLEQIGLWAEDPRWTPTWVHWQTRPPHSGLRVYRPSMNEALAAALPEQIESTA